MAVSLAGVALAWLIFGRARRRAEKWRDSRNPLLLWWREAFGFDWLYDQLFVRPYLGFIRVNARDFIDQLVALIPASLRAVNGWLARTQTGQLRWYVASLGLGAVVVVGTVMLT